MKTSEYVLECLPWWELFERYQAVLYHPRRNGGHEKDIVWGFYAVDSKYKQIIDQRHVDFEQYNSESKQVNLLIRITNMGYPLLNMGLNWRQNSGKVGLRLSTMSCSTGYLSIQD